MTYTPRDKFENCQICQYCGQRIRRMCIWKSKGIEIFEHHMDWKYNYAANTCFTCWLKRVKGLEMMK